MDEKYLKMLKGLDNLGDAISLLDVFLDYCGDIIYYHHYDPVCTQREADARIIFQMFFSKALHFKHMLKGVGFNNGNFILNTIVDPTLLFTLLRNQYECLCLFELINMIPNSDDKKEFLSLIHQISGLQYRQRFKEQATTPESQSICFEEAAEIEYDMIKIYSSSVYQNLSQMSKDKVRLAIKHKEFQLFFKSDSEIQKLGWKDFANKFGMKKGCIDNLYTYLCLNAHPSYPSIRQFGDAFKKNEPEFIKMAVFAAQTFIIFMSVFVVDYMRMFPNVLDIFKKLNLDKQELLIAYNDIFREEQYKANF